MNKHTAIKKICMLLLCGISVVVFVAFAMGAEAFAAKNNPRPKKMNTYVSFHKLYVGQVIGLRVAPKNATIKVRFSPENKYTKKMGVHVTSSNSRIIKVMKKDKFHFKLKAMSPGSASIHIKSLGKGYYGKKLEARIRLHVLESKSIRSMNAQKNGIDSFKLSFDTKIMDSFDKNSLKIKLYDKGIFVREVPMVSYEYSKGNSFDVFVKLSSDLQSNATYRIEYKEMQAEVSTDQLGVVRLEPVNLKIPKDRSTRLEFKAFDKDGNDITNSSFYQPNRLKVKLSNSTSSKVKLIHKSSDYEILMMESGAKAVVEVSYQDVSGRFELLCDDMVDSSLYNVYKNTVVYNGFRVNWDEVNENETPVLEKGKTDGFIAVLLKTKDGKFISNRKDDQYYEPTASFRYSVAKGVKIKVDEQTGALGTAKDGRYSVQIKMTYQGNDYQYIFPVSVEETKLSKLTVSPSELLVSNKEGQKEVSLLYRDDKGRVVEERNISSGPVIKYLNSDADSSKPNSESASISGLVKVDPSSNLKLIVNAQNKPAGVYYYELSFGDSKKNMVKSYLTIQVQDSTKDLNIWDYKFKELVDNPVLDMTIRSQDSYRDIQDREKGIDLGLYAYNQFGTPIGISTPVSFKINGQPYDPVKMPYIRYTGGVPYFVPYEIQETGGKTTVTKMAKPGHYHIFAEVYHARFNRTVTYTALLNVTDDTPGLTENVDFKVKRTGESGTTTVLQPGMSGTVSEIAAQIVTGMNGERFSPEIKATGFDLRYPNTPVQFMSYGNHYLIDRVSIPVSRITRDGKEIFLYVEEVLNINLSK